MSATFDEAAGPGSLVAAPHPALRALWGRFGEIVVQGVRFSAAGVLGTLAYVGLYMLFDLWLPVLAGNALAWLITTVATNEAQRRWAFGVRHGHTADVVIGLITSGATLVVTTVAVGVLHDTDVSGAISAIIAINTAAGIARFLTVRWWYAHRRAAVTAA